MKHGPGAHLEVTSPRVHSGDDAEPATPSGRGAAQERPSLVHDVDRRTLLSGLCAAGVSVVVAGTGGLSYRIYDNGVLDSGAGTPYDAWDHWDTDPRPIGAVAAAILAANPHNTQAWGFRVMPDRIEVVGDPTRTRPAVDPFLREHHIGIGCALENLSLGLAARGQGSRLEILPEAGSGPLATAVLAPGPKIRSTLYDAIGDRHSNRGPYTSAAVPAETLDGLAALSRDLPGVSVRWFATNDEKAALTALILDATRAFIADGAQSREAFSWFRNGRDAINLHRDGPTLDAQGLGSFTLTLAKILPASSRHAGDAFWLEQTRTVHTATAAAYGVVTVADADDVGLRLAGGRLLQRIHLAATAGGLALQHMNQVTERMDRERGDDGPDSFARRFEVLLPPGRQALASFRLGFAARPARRSPRRALADVVA